MTTEGKRKILLIDDDTSLLVTLSDFLTFEGYDVTTADSGEQGLKRLKKMEPNLIILDMSMPGMGGVGFLKEISPEVGKPKYPVLVLTARANMAEFFADMDVDGFVSKPCDPNDLLMEVSRIIFLRSGGKQEKKAVGAAEKKKRILIGEDDPSLCRQISDAFGSRGYLVDCVQKGPEVLELAIVERPDVVVVKLLLSSMNGDTVAAMMKEMPNTRGIPIVLYDDSGSDTPEARYIESGTGIKRVVHSHDSDELVAAVDGILAG